MLRSGRVIGIPVTVGSFANITGKIIEKSHLGDDGYVCVANVHMVTTARRNDKLRQIMEKALVTTTDGLPLVWVLKKNGFNEAERITGTDLTLSLCERAAAEGIPVCFYGGTMDTIRALGQSINSRFPELNVALYESPPILPERPKIDPQVADRLNKSGARIVFVGLGCPKQEFWMAAYTSHLSAVLIGVGAAFDFIAGTVKRAPVRIQTFGLEWLYRMSTDPLRTWKRYLTTNPRFIWIVIKDYFNKNLN